MFLTHSQQALAVAVLRIAPLVTSTTSATFAYLSHAYVAGFKHREVSYEARSAVIPGWWDHIRPLSLVIIWGSFIPSFIFGLLNAYNATLGGLLGDGTRGMVGPLAGKLYLIGGWVSKYLAFVLPSFLFFSFFPFPNKSSYITLLFSKQ